MLRIQKKLTAFGYVWAVISEEPIVEIDGKAFTTFSVVDVFFSKHEAELKKSAMEAVS